MSKKAVEIPVASSDATAKPKEKDELKKDGLSEEDQLVKDEVELLVTRIQDEDLDLAAVALASLAKVLRTASGSVASIPKPLKFVRAWFGTLVEHEKKVKAPAFSRKLCDVIAMIAMTMELDGVSSLSYKLRGTTDDLHEWGHEFQRFLAGEIATEWQKREESGADTDDLKHLARQIMTYMMHHADEAAACDLALEIGEPKWTCEFCDEGNFTRVAQYLSAVARYLPVPDNREVWQTVFDIYTAHNSYVGALRVALVLNDSAMVCRVFAECTDRTMKKQLALICGRHRIVIESDDDDVNELMGNLRLSEWYLHTARDLDSIAPKTPDDIYKNYLIDQRAAPSATNSHMQNLASTFVNGFINAGYGKDKLLATEGTTYLYQTKDHRMMSAAASIGLVNLWDHNEGLGGVDKYTYSDDNYIKAGALLATGLVMTNVRSQFDPAIALLSDYLANTHREVRIGAILGLGFAYSGSQKSDVKDLLIPLVADSDQPVEIQCFAAYALGLVFAGSCDEDISEAAMACLMEKDEAQLQDPSLRYLILAIGTLFIGREEAADTLIEATTALSPLIQKYAEAVVIGCAYAGTGNVVMIQKMFSLVAEEHEEADEASSPTTEAAASADGAGAAAAATATSSDKPKPFNFRAAAVLSIAQIALGEHLGTDMSKRALLHALVVDQVTKLEPHQSGRRAVPLALALLSISNPDMPVVESLSKLSHDADINTAQSAILGLGLVAAGTNNARVATMLRNLSSYYGSKERDAPLLFVVRVAQGLVALGKGHITLSPIHSDNLLVSPTSTAALLGLLHSALDFEKTILDRYHFMIYAITPAMHPRMLITVDAEELKPVQTELRIGQPVDTVTVAGKPKTITGFQTHKTPVLLNEGDRAELSIGTFRAITPIIEGVVIVEPKPEVKE